jgi:hypothetical protein
VYGLVKMSLRPSRLQASTESSGTIARSVVSHDALALHAQAGIVSDGCFEEGDSAFFSLVLHHAAEGDAGGIVDVDVNELPADTKMAVDHASSASGDAMRIEALRRQRLTGKAIAVEVGVSEATVSRILRRLGLNKLNAVEPAEPVRRFEREKPGEFIHLDIQKLGKIGSMNERPLRLRKPRCLHRYPLLPAGVEN